MKILLSFILVIQSSIVFTQSLNCDQFKTGRFYTDTPQLGRTYIQRTDSLQIEKNDSAGYHYVLKVNWIDSCEYTLSLLENKSTASAFSPPSDQFFMRVKITEVIDKQSYRTEANLNGGQYKYGGIINKIED